MKSSSKKTVPRRLVDSEVADILADAMELPLPEREKFLSKKMASDPALGNLIRELMPASSAFQNFLESISKMPQHDFDAAKKYEAEKIFGFYVMPGFDTSILL